MKKIIFLKEKRIKKAIENWSISGIANQLNLRLSYNRFPTISDQEIEFWENVSEPWNVDEDSFQKASFEYFNKSGGDLIE